MNSMCYVILRCKQLSLTCDSGRALSMQFMELPSRKQWPIYYTIIKKPQCIGNVFVRVDLKYVLVSR